MSHYPFPARRPNPKRKEPRRVIGRERLHGEAKEQRRREIFERSQGHCEEDTGRVLMPLNRPILCGAPITWDSMHWSHNLHGGRKCDCLKCGIASCEECHRKRHNAGGKPCNRRPGRTMKQSEALAYLKSDRCFCDKAKRTLTAFCDDCISLLSDQQRFDLEHVTHKEFLKLMADCELTILAETAKQVTA